jgi:hypothetical protein
MKYKSTMTNTRNEIGKAEVEIEYHNGFFRWLLGMEEKKKTYVADELHSIEWLEKDTLKPVSFLLASEILCIVNQHKGIG